MSGRVHRFGDSVKEGDKGEKLIVAYLRAQGCEAKRVTDMSLQRKGVDIEARDAEGNEFTVEVKRDTRTIDTGNIAVETHSNLEAGTPGWAYKRSADYLFYIVHPTHVYALRMDSIDDTIIEAWDEQFQSRRIPNWKNRGKRGGKYHSRIICVPEPVFAELSFRRIPLKG